MTRTYWALLIVAFIVITILFPHQVGYLAGVWPAPAGTSPWYQLWSGIVPGLAIVGVVWPFVNCHIEGCPRYGRYRIDGFKVCHAHHPSDEVRKGGISFEHIVRLHRNSRNNR